MSEIKPEGAWPSAGAMSAEVERVLVGRYGPLVRGEFMSPPPAGLRLEMHPTAFYAFFRDDFARGWVASQDTLKAVFHVPVRITADAPDRGWRLVIVTEETLLDGLL